MKRSISSWPSERAGRVVRVRDENEARPRRDGGDHPVEIVAKIGTWHFDRARAENGRDHFVGDESVLRSDDFVARD